MAYVDNLLASGEQPSGASTSTGSSSSPTPATRSSRWIAAILLLILSGSVSDDSGIGSTARRSAGSSSSSSSAACCTSAGRSLRWHERGVRRHDRGGSSSRGRDQQAVVDSSLEKINDAVLTAVALRPDVRLRRPRDPDRVRERDLAAPDAPPAPTTSSGRCSTRSTSSSWSCRAPGRCRSPPMRAGRAARAADDRRPRRPAGAGRRARGSAAAPPRPRCRPTTSPGRWRASPTCATAARSAPRSTRRRRPTCSAACSIRCQRRPTRIAARKDRHPCSSRTIPSRRSP